MINKVRLTRMAEDFFKEKLRGNIDSIAKELMEEQFNKAKGMSADEVDAYAKALSEAFTAECNAAIDLMVDYATELATAMEPSEG